MESARLLQVEGLSRKIGQYAVLQDISFALFEREIVGLIGPNGAGKTTLMECVSGLQPVDRGSVKFKDQEQPISRRQDHLFYQPDQVLPYPDHGVSHTLEFFREMFDQSRERAHELIERLKLGSAVSKKVGELSRGYQKRLLLTIGLMSRVPILFLDEPFEGLDVKQVREVVSVLKDERERGRSLFLSIHQINDAQKISDRFLLLNRGLVLGSGTLDDLRSTAALKNGSLEDIFVALTKDDN